MKNYLSLRAENEELKEQVEGLQSELLKKEDRIEKLEGKEKKLERRESELKDVKGELEKAESELKDLKEIKAFGGLSLGEATEKFLESREAEIDERSRQKFREVKEEYEEKLPQMIEKRLSEVLAKPRSEWPPKIEELVDSKAKEISNHILEERKNWPEWFKKYFQREVSCVARKFAEFFEEGLSGKQTQLYTQKDAAGNEKIGWGKLPAVQVRDERRYCRALGEGNELLFPRIPQVANPVAENCNRFLAMPCDR